MKDDTIRVCREHPGSASRFGVANGLLDGLDRLDTRFMEPEGAKASLVEVLVARGS